MKFSSLDETSKLLCAVLCCVLTVYFSPFKVLNAPRLQDTFCLNLLDWGSQNILSVGLERSVYVWPAGSVVLKRICGLTGIDDFVTSVAWNKYVSISQTYYFTQDSENYFC
jgi:cell division cycle 20-like protein 1 (cofactor of APC complex)